jgi:GAF domain-containing protein
MYHYSNLSSDEISRLEILRKLKILDSPYEALFNTITRAISEICNSPIALISFVEDDRHWFKPKVGLAGAIEIPIELAFCWSTILSNGVFEVEDATLDARFKDNPLVTGKPHIRFFAGAAISLPLGEKIGSLCVMDTQPNQLSDYKRAALEGFAKVISQALIIRDAHSRTALGNGALDIAFKKPTFS